MLIPIPGRIQVVTERISGTRSAEPADHILHLSVVWRDREPKGNGGGFLVRFSQDNWHRIMDAAQGSDFEWFVDTWKELLGQGPSGRDFSEQCDICLRLDRSGLSHPGSNAIQTEGQKHLDRNRVFTHFLSNQPLLRDNEREIIADH